MRYRHVIWDWNGTLLDDTWLCVEVLNTLLPDTALPPITLGKYPDHLCLSAPCPPPPTPLHARPPAPTAPPATSPISAASITSTPTAKLTVAAPTSAPLSSMKTPAPSS